MLTLAAKLVEFPGLTTAAQGRRVLLTENFKAPNSFLWRQLTASGPSPNTLFLSPRCPQCIRQGRIIDLQFAPNFLNSSTRGSERIQGCKESANITGYEKLEREFRC